MPRDLSVSLDVLIACVPWPLWALDFQGLLFFLRLNTRHITQEIKLCLLGMVTRAQNLFIIIIP